MRGMMRLALLGVPGAQSGGATTGYRKSITIAASQVAADLEAFPVLLLLDSDIDLAAHTDGTDIYVTQSDGTTVVPHEIEYYDPATGKLALWFKANLNAEVNAGFYLYYGSGELVTSPGSAVWDTSYKAVWHMGERVTLNNAFTNDGALIPIYPSNISPSAYYYNGRTYIAYQGPNEDPYVACYDHNAPGWLAPQKVGTNPLTDDDHGAPAIIVDDDGYIHVFYGSHQTPLKHAISTTPESISDWTAQSDIGDGTTYPNVVKDGDGTLHLFYRYAAGSKYDLVYTTSNDYTTITTLVEAEELTGDLIYHGNVEYDATRERIYFGWCRFDIAPLANRVNVYAAYLDLVDSHLYTVGGVDLGTRIDATEAEASCLIVNTESEGYSTQFPTLHLDNAGNPHIIYQGESATGTKHWHLYWTGAAWVGPAIITDASNRSNFSDFYFDGAVIEAYLTTNSPSENSGDQGGDIEHWRYAEAEWSKISTVYDASEQAVYNGGNYPQVVRNGVDALRVVFCEPHYVDVANDQYVYAIASDDTYLGRLLSTNAFYDSTSNGHTLTPTEGLATGAGKIANGFSFDGGADRASFDNLLSAASPITLEGWFKPGGENVVEPEAGQVLIDLRGNYNLFMGWYEADEATNPNKFFVNVGNHRVYSDASPADGNWYYIVFTHDGTTMRMYRNGSAGATQAASEAGAPPAPINMLGKDFDTEQNRLWFRGEMDEVRISQAARSAEWITTSYNNQNAPDSFIALGNAEAV